MKRKLIALTAACSLSLSVLAIVNAEDPADAEPEPHRHGEMGRHRWGTPLDKLDENLNLTAEQKTKVQPIVDQAKPQIQAIHQDAMQRTKAVVDNTMSRIRPLLTIEQQQKLDALQKAHEDKRNARKEVRDARTQ
jgi:Spy/CpxP family protein refolding chaperone